jgi:alpha-mannosidase
MCVGDDENGTPLRGLTTGTSAFDFTLGMPGKRVLPLSDHAAGGETVEVWADAGCNDLFGNLQGGGTVREARIATCDETVRALYYDFEVLLDFLKTLPEDSPRYEQVLTGLNDALHALYGGISQSAATARAILAPHLARHGGDPALSVSAVGHAHMDLGWLWPVRETMRKAARTFATAVANIERYPDYVFGASQPQQYQWMKDRYPALYAKIKQAVSEGRIEPQGVMWVEADTNVSGGEALVRQVLQGKRFWREEFGVEVDYLWLPDVFGYSAALPQILRRSGTPYFSTQKLSWSLINVFPHHSFHWQGIDGSKVLAHMLPEETYNGPALPRSVRKIERNYRDKGISRHSLMVFGIGDGGGGPGEEHLERLARLHNLEGLSPVEQEPVAAFIKKWRTDAGRFPTWWGELYLERHQGTLTTEARNKWYNRKLELALRELEWTSIIAGLVGQKAYPADRLQTIWREILLYQFHDILPGSSIKRVYDESLARYALLLDEIEGLIADNDACLAAEIDTLDMIAPLLAQNSLSWTRREWLRVGERWLQVTAPPMGYVVVDSALDTVESASDAPPVTADKHSLENEVLRVHFGEDGAIDSLYDKRLQRELIPAGQTANCLTVYRDLGDAWDFPMDYAEQTPRRMALVASSARVDGPRAVLEQTYRLGYSELQQEITLTAGSARLDFASRLHWRETQAMLRTSFPVAVHNDEATFEIQFGHVRRPTHRNTTWDLARDEVVGHKWVDLSQRDYGVALLNDSKYGHKVKDQVIDLNLLRSVPYPGPVLVNDADVAPGEAHHGYTDQCDHRFTYALFPHPGDHVAGRVVRAAYELNIPLRTLAMPPQSGRLPARASFMELEAANVIVEAVKQAEDGKDLIVRLYEAEGQAARTAVRFGFPVAGARETDLLEQPLAVGPALKDGQLRLEFGPFEIKTLKVEIAPPVDLE